MADIRKTVPPTQKGRVKPSPPHAEPQRHAGCRREVWVDEGQTLQCCQTNAGSPRDPLTPTPVHG